MSGDMKAQSNWSGQITREKTPLQWKFSGRTSSRQKMAESFA